MDTYLFKSILAINFHAAFPVSRLEDGLPIAFVLD